mmetsp:Transcript_37661/g.80021  ORF Transcript_37661/g.80021 Transcript_37661/m.80021 type:complete len:201 (+) Transcript_37661:1615-2217(+)
MDQFHLPVLRCLAFAREHPVTRKVQIRVGVQFLPRTDLCSFLPVDAFTVRERLIHLPAIISPQAPVVLIQVALRIRVLPIQQGLTILLDHPVDVLVALPGPFYHGNRPDGNCLAALWLHLGLRRARLRRWRWRRWCRRLLRITFRRLRIPIIPIPAARRRATSIVAFGTEGLFDRFRFGLRLRYVLQVHSYPLSQDLVVE